MIGVGTAGLLGVATALDLARPEASRTHLGRFASRVADDGVGEIIDTFLRKQEANLRILEVSTWVRMVVLLVAVLAVLLGPRAQRVRLAPRGSTVAIGTVATLAAALVGFLTNDSGPIVVGLFATFLLPFVLLPALELSASGSEPADLLSVGLEPVAGDREGRVVDGLGDRGRVG
jgi:hypothetical protein